MFSRAIITAVAALLASSTIAVSAAPTSTPTPSLSTNEFLIYLQASGYPTLSLNILDVGNGESQFYFDRPSVYPGTPAFLNGSALIFDTGSGIPNGATFAEVGDNYGITVPFYADEGSQGREGFAVGSDGILTARLDAALESFFACNTTINNEGHLGLFWGVYQSNGSAPQNCVAAELQTANITSS